jgi:hypothetical protein
MANGCVSLHIPDINNFYFYLFRSISGDTDLSDVNAANMIAAAIA